MEIQIKNLIDEDFCNYKKPALFIGMPRCSFKCDKECGRQVCQNSELANAPIITMDKEEIAKRYWSNPITEAIVLGGLEPFDGELSDIHCLLDSIRHCELRGEKALPDIVIYTGYYPSEIKEKVTSLAFWTALSVVDGYDTIIIKFGRFIPDTSPIFDEVLGVELASNNQKAMKIFLDPDTNDLILEEKP